MFFAVAFGPLVGIGMARAESDKRIALVIGNNDYQIVRPRLENAAADARDIGRALESSGFDTAVKANVKRRELYQLIDAFAAKIAASPDTIGLFYYAGHGIQANGKNYLIPVDSDLQSEADLEAEAVDAGKVLRAMEEAHNSVNILILDACRDNPLPKGRSLSRGLATMQGPRGTFIGYAAAPGQTAQDGNKGANGVFTGTLVEQLHEPGLPIEEVFKRTIAGVMKRTGGKQVPWMESSLQGNFYFVAPLNVTVAPSSNLTASNMEVIFWESIKNSTDPADFDDFVKRYPTSQFASIAQRRLASLKVLPPPINSSDTETKLSLDQRREVQRALKMLGHFQGDSDGAFGTGTQTAIRQFQSFVGTTPTGLLLNREYGELLDMAQRLGVLLDQPGISPEGVAASSIKGATARFAHAWAAETGKGARQDVAEAIYWYALAATDSDARAFANLGTIVARGYGTVGPDPLLAMVLWQASAARGEAAAMYNLGAMYEQGIGVGVDVANARRWYERAATRGHQDARLALKRL